MLSKCTEHRGFSTLPSRNDGKENKRGVNDVEADGPACPDIGNVEREEFPERYIPPGDQRREDYRVVTFCYSPLFCLLVCGKVCKLAASGFYYTGEDLNVACFSCGNAIRDWPKADAFKPSCHKSDCKMAKGGNSGNVALESLWKEALLKFTDACVNQESSELPQGPSEHRISSAQMAGTMVRGRNRNRGDVDYVGADGPACPDVGNIEREEIPERYVPPGDHRDEGYRLATFWYSPLFCFFFCDKIWKFAASGFYYTGKDEKVTCFSCGHEVRDWTMEDNPFNPCCHKYDCRMAKCDEPGNVPLESPWREAVLKCTGGCGNQEFNENTQDPPESAVYRDEMAGNRGRGQADISNLNPDMENAVAPTTESAESSNSHDSELSAMPEEGAATLPTGAGCRSRKRSEKNLKETPPAKKHPDEPRH